MQGGSINLDTLARLIWEYIQEQGYQVIMRYDYPLIGAVLIDKDLKEVGDENDFISETPLEVWIELLEWIAKEKNLLWHSIDMM